MNFFEVSAFCFIDFYSFSSLKFIDMCCVQEIHLKYKKTVRWKAKGGRMIYYTSINQKKAGVAIISSDRADFRPRKGIRDKEGHYII